MPAELGKVMQLEHCSSIGNTSVEQQHVNEKQQHFHFHLNSSDLLTLEQTSKHCSSIGNTSMEQQHEYHEQQHFHFHLSFSDLLTPEQTSVMQMEHCSSIGNTSMEQQHEYYEQQHFHLNFRDLFTLQQTLVMHLEHCSSIGNTSTINNMKAPNNKTFTWASVISSPRNKPRKRSWNTDSALATHPKQQHEYYEQQHFYLSFSDLFTTEQPLFSRVARTWAPAMATHPRTTPENYKQQHFYLSISFLHRQHINEQELESYEQQNFTWASVTYL
jgi:hypothetical protein